jgi:hypothetical protein
MSVFLKGQSIGIAQKKQIKEGTAISGQDFIVATTKI